MPPSSPSPPPTTTRRDSDEDRWRFIVEAQRHCDHYLTPVAAPHGRSVLVAGAGAGTEMLWCIRHGAREVVGIDRVEQSPAALERAVREIDPRCQVPFSISRLAIEDAAALGRRFDLVLSNNTFEHVGDLGRAFQACAGAVAPGGRVAVFTAPLYFSSAGSHLATEPWEHLWADPEELRRRLLADLPPRHPLHTMSMGHYFDDEISLNRMRLADFLAAVWASGLAVLNLRLIRDRHWSDFSTYAARLANLRSEDGLHQRPGTDPPFPPHPADFLIEGIAAELALPGAAGPEPLAATEDVVREHRVKSLEHLYESAAQRFAALQTLYDQATATATAHGGTIADLTALAERQATEIDHWRDQAQAHERESTLRGQTAAGLKQTLDAVEASWSFRLGRRVTAPARLLRKALDKTPRR
jgi:SAM-dependent methyltransferase